MDSFQSFALNETLLHNVRGAGYTTPTPIQAQSIPALLTGRDLLGCAQTGTGKTAAFCLPLLQRLAEHRQRPGRRACRALILTPTRELAAQIGDNLEIYGEGLRLSHVLIYGGVPYTHQIRTLGRGVDIVVATPGRLLDLLRQGHLRLDEVAVLVLDEADRMLDMGFIHDIREVLAEVPARRQTMFFSATMGGPARDLADGILRDPVQAAVTPEATPVELVDQQLMFVEGAHKKALLHELLEDEGIERALVFCRTKHGASRLAKQLQRPGSGAEAIHGGLTQSARQRALAAFRAGRVRVLVATDVAARGLDVDGITHVINFDLPDEPECYVHRIGRTGRAGAGGTAISFCSAEERDQLLDIERLIREPIACDEAHPLHSSAVAAAVRSPRGGGVRQTRRPTGRRPVARGRSAAYRGR